MYNLEAEVKSKSGAEKKVYLKKKFTLSYAQLFFNHLLMVCFLLFSVLILATAMDWNDAHHHCVVS